MTNTHDGPHGTHGATVQTNAKKYRTSRDGSITLDLTDDERIVLAGELLTDLIASLEILYKHEVPERYERLKELQRHQRDIVHEKSQEWIERLKDQGRIDRLSAEQESLLMQAFLAGWRSAPLGPRAIRP